MSIVQTLAQVAFTAHKEVFKATRGKVLGRFWGPILLLRTTGRKSGRQRENALMYLADGERCVIVASNGGARRHPSWYLNLEANPDVEVHLGSEVKRMRAREVVGREREQLWPRIVDQYSGYEGYQQKTDRQIPVVVLEPAGLD